MPNSAGTGFVSGLTVTGNNGLQTATISAGACRDSTNVFTMVSTGTLTITMTTVGANGRDAGAATDGVWYVFVISTATGALAALASTSSTAPTLPGGYVYFRRVGTLTYISGAVVGTVTAGQDSIRTTIYTTTISQLSSSAGNFTQSWANYVPATAHLFYSGFHWFSTANANYSNSMTMDSSPWEGFFLIDSDGFSSGRGMIEGTIPLRPGGTRVFTATRSGAGTMGWYSYCMGYQESV